MKTASELSSRLHALATSVLKIAYAPKVAVLVQKHNDHTDRKEWALVSKKDHDKVLKWFGAEKPSEDAVAKEERRVQYFKHL